MASILFVRLTCKHVCRHDDMLTCKHVVMLTCKQDIITYIITTFSKAIHQTIRTVIYHISLPSGLHVCYHVFLPSSLPY